MRQDWNTCFDNRVAKLQEDTQDLTTVQMEPMLRKYIKDREI